jgi:adenosylcobinamide-GDP ribazoletransferase
MVLLANRGLSAWEGFSSPFTAAMKDTNRMLAATAMMLAMVFFSAGYAGLVALAVSVSIAGIMKHVSGRSFGGISGDVLGASNEVSRLASLIVLSSIPAIPVVMTIF